MSDEGQSRVFWPEHATHLPRGYLVGYIEPDGIVVSSVISDVKVMIRGNMISLRVTGGKVE